MVDGHCKILAVIQARLGSTRLPNKVLMSMPANSEVSILQRIIDALYLEKKISKVVVATSTNKINDDIENICGKLNVSCFRGSENDVLSRFYEVIKDSDYDFVLRFTGDNPILDIKHLDVFIKNHLEKSLNYSYSEGLPLGCNFEMISTEVLKIAYKESTDSYDREHVTPFIKRNFKLIETFNFSVSEKFKKYRFTVDYPSDYALLSLMYSMLENKASFELLDFIDLIDKNPWLLKVNEENTQKNKFDSLEEEVNYILPKVRELELLFIEKLLLNAKEK
ncbi:spore coat polysaccharide biosynthesis protein SpsF [Lutibacter oricola]|uniref:Spore coat polysaccharide biosynthesis protein SpsF n=1 Tax=Lutibacter oricola TaxID=762486 RepID=A0A1H2TP58_9FLAO|nr:hypothetical protein [Lutibacter oricola]SDW45557.1 spore coat polysaccharide biosynthesis protein SpsF [Lutibacter oricola]